MNTRIQPFDIGCEPSPAVPSEVLLADGWKTVLLFFAVSKDVNASGHLTDLGVAVLDCQNCVASKFGYPNDEGAPEHPLYHHGMSDVESSVLEVVDSPWAHEVSVQMHASGRRIWGGRGLERGEERRTIPRHFILPMKEKTFECLASSLVVERFCETFEDAYSHVLAAFINH